MRKAMRKATRFGRTTRTWLMRQWLRRTQPHAAALLEGASGLGLPELQSFMAREFEQHGLAATSAALHAAIEAAPRMGEPRIRRGLYTAATRAMSTFDLGRAIAFGEQYVDHLSDPRAVRSLVTFHKRAGNYDRALALIEKLPVDEWRETTRALLQRRSLEQRLERQFGAELRAASVLGDDQIQPVAERMFAAVDSRDRRTAYRLLRRVLGKAFRSSKRLSAQLISDAGALDSLDGVDVHMALAVCEAHLHRGSIGQALAELNRLAGDNPRAASHRARLESLTRLDREGFVHQAAVIPDADPYVPVAGRVLCLLHNSLPHNSGGYATRSHGLLSGLVRRGWDVSGVTRLGYPPGKSKKEAAAGPTRIDEVSYYRLAARGAPYGGVTHDYVNALTEALLELARVERPEFLHASSNHLNGLAANAAARALGIKSIYEVRGLWEVARLSRQPDWQGTEHHELVSRLEAQAAKEADAVICITTALAEEMIRRGVPAEKITLVPNGVDVDRFKPRPRNDALAERLGLAGKKVIGYVGSVVDYEGLDLLLRAIVLLRDRGVEGFAVLIVGDGGALEGLQRLAAELGLSDLAVFAGRVPHEEVEDYYSIVDVAPFPRKSLPVTEMISPLKPFEAMAMGKVVIASSVGALAEFIEDGVNGILFRKDDVGDLADKLEAALRPELAGALRPRDWVVGNRSWRDLSAITDGVYKRLTSPLQPVPQVKLDEIKLAPDIAKVRAVYAARYDAQGKPHLRRDDYARWSYVAEQIRHHGSLLDVGVGQGQFVNAMAARGAFQRVVGVDVKKHTKFLRLDDSYAMDYVSVAELPYRDGEFDVVTCMETIEHLPEDIFIRGISELRRVCGKQLIITVPFREEKLSKGHFRRFDFADLEALFPGGEVKLFRRQQTFRGRAAFWALIEENVERTSASRG